MVEESDPKGFSKGALCLEKEFSSRRVAEYAENL
jgi:hypothetical protein